MAPASFAPFLLLTALLGCSDSAAQGGAKPQPPVAQDQKPMTSPTGSAPSSRPTFPKDTETATFGAGCFWCVEAVLEQIDGVLEVRSGYMGGHVKNPTYKQVCTGETGHVEVVQVRFDPKKLPYAMLLEWFWQLHDPTQKDGQGNDIGPQYRSAIFWHSDAQRLAAEKAKAALETSKKLKRPVVTELAKAAEFYEAEEYHQDYYRNNKAQGYCRMVIAPKLEKLGLEK